MGLACLVMKGTGEKYRYPEWTAFRVEGWRMPFSEKQIHSLAERESKELSASVNTISVILCMSLVFSFPLKPPPSHYGPGHIHQSPHPPTLASSVWSPTGQVSGTACSLWTSQWLSLSHFHITFSISLSRSMTLGSVRVAVWAFSFRRLFLYSRILSSW